MIYRNMKIGTRVGIITIVIVAIAVAALINGYLSRERSLNNSLVLETVALPKTFLAGQLLVDAVLSQQKLTDVAASRDVAGFAKAEQSARSFKQGVGKLRAMYAKENDAANLKMLTELETAFVEMYAAGQRMTDAFLDVGLAIDHNLRAEFDVQTATLVGLLESFQKLQIEEMNENFQVTNVSFEKYKKLQMIIFPLIILIIASLLLFLSVSITRPLKAAVVVARRLAVGDLTVDFPAASKDETGQLLLACRRWLFPIVR